METMNANDSGTKKTYSHRAGADRTTSEWIRVELPETIPERIREFAGRGGYVMTQWSDDFSSISKALRRIENADNECIVGFDAYYYTGRNQNRYIAAIIICGCSTCIITRAHEMRSLPQDLKAVMSSQSVLKVCTFRDDNAHADAEYMFDWAKQNSGDSNEKIICSTKTLFDWNGTDDLSSWSREWVGCDVNDLHIDPDYCWLGDNIDHEIVRQVTIKTWVDMWIASKLTYISDPDTGALLDAGVPRDWIATRWPTVAIDQQEPKKRTHRGRRGGVKHRQHYDELAIEPSTSGAASVECGCKKQFTCTVCNSVLNQNEVESHFTDIRHFIAMKSYMQS